MRRCRQGFLQFAQREGFIFIKPPSRLRACETTDFVRDGLEARTEGFARIQALGDQLLIATTKTCIYVGKFFLASSSFQIV